MSCNHSDFDPTVLGQYREAPQLLHFQFEGPDYTVHRYALVDEIEFDEIDPRTKKRKSELLLSHYQIRLGYIK